MKLTQENNYWIEHCANLCQSTPEAFLNGLINSLKSQLGPSPENLKDWLEKNEKLKESLTYNLEKLESTRILVEEISRAAKLYLTQVKDQAH